MGVSFVQVRLARTTWYNNSMVVQVKCALCKRIYSRPANRVKEAQRHKWKQYCSVECMAKSKLCGKELLCSNQECRHRFYRSRCAILRVGSYYCSRNCAAHINGQKFPKRGPGFKFCVDKECGNRMKGWRKYCSHQCWRRARVVNPPNELIDKLQLLAKKLERTPAKREATLIAEACTHAFGSWNNAIVAAGLIPHRSHSNRMYRRTNTTAKDGHKCDSISEAIIDNWLTKNNISHKRDVAYPKTGHKADWSVGANTFIEYFGLAKDSPSYDRNIKAKIKLCKKSGIKLVGIYPKDLYPVLNIEKKLGSIAIIKNHLISSK